MIQANRSQKTSDSLANNYIFGMFWTIFPWWFPPFYARGRIASITLCSVALGALCERATVSESLPSLFKKRDFEQLAQVAHVKRGN